MLDKKILYVQHSGANGGAPMSLFYLLEFVRKEYDIVVYFITDGPAVEFYRKAGIQCKINTALGKLPHCTIENQSLNPLSAKFYHNIKVYVRHYMKLLPSYYEMKKIIAFERPDIVHLNSSVLIAEGLATKSMGVPLVWHMRDFLEYGNFKLRYRVFRKIISSCADVVIALCDSELNRVKPEKRGVVIPNFVNFDKFNPEKVEPVNLRKKLGIAEKSKIIAMLGWNTPAKGALTLLKAFANIKDMHPEAVLVLFGEGERIADQSRLRNVLRILTGKKNLRLQIQEIIDRNGLQERVFFPGVIFDIANYIAEVDIIAAPFTEPHFARPILEAGAMKKLIITSDIDGTREMVLNGEAGFLAATNDEADWARKLNIALGDSHADKIGLMYQNTRQTYNADINAEKTIEEYRNILRI
ncbi:glycosyltransferase [Methylomonas sp. SURF-1]|uniref:Glycosyltransferase n=1 Tax=Methylomonas aurea TaxID=2952224 RepID=A0ABT1UNE4_9GAMM|nr:glycosyltransferase [Methylomonas sp. SURF-1]MCQ8183170.1 glycosyltransferase [Methylomonas sp. SURF-1]